MTSDKCFHLLSQAILLTAKVVHVSFAYGNFRFKTTQTRRTWGGEGLGGGVTISLANLPDKMIVRITT